MKCDVCGTKKGFANYGDVYTVICKDCYGTEEANKLLNDIERRVKQNELDKREDILKPENSQNKIIVGIILFIIGLVAIIMRVEITLKIVGKSGVLRDAISMGSGKTETTLIVITIISIFIMILGLIILVNAILKTINKN